MKASLARALVFAFPCLAAGQIAVLQIKVLDGEGAVELYSEALEADRDYDAVILDLIVKVGMGGMEALQKMQYLNPKVRAIASSGNTTDPVMQNHVKYGFRDVLRKPYDLEHLKDALARVSGQGSGQGMRT